MFLINKEEEVQNMVIIPPSIKDSNKGGKFGRFVIVNDTLRAQPK
jgi:hypothetical protein